MAERHRLDLIVGDVDRGHTQALLQSLDLDPHLHPQLGVQVGERLVEQEHLRLTHDGAAHGDALALPAGEQARLAVEQFVQLQDFRCLLHPRGNLRLGHAAYFQAVGHILAHAHVRIERVVLEDHGDVALRRLQSVDDAVGNGDLAVGNALQPGDHPQQGGLAATGRPDQHQKLAIDHVDVDAMQRLEAVRVDFRHIADGKVGHGYFSVSTSPRTNRRCMPMTIRTGGSMPSIVAAMTRFQSGTVSPAFAMREMPTTIM